MKLDLMIMSGVEDGLTLNFDSENNDGQRALDGWTLIIGRAEDADVCLRNDTFISRRHAELRWRDDRWWLFDNDSKNGTFLETEDDDLRVKGEVPLKIDKLFRIGRTWMRLQPVEDDDNV